MKFLTPATLLALLLMAGCSMDGFGRASGGESAPDYAGGALWDDDDDEVDDPSDDDDAAGEGLEVFSVDPLPDSVDHHYRDPIVVAFSGYALGADVDLYDKAGRFVPSSVEWSEAWDRAVLSPIVPLDPQAGYEVEIQLGDTELAYSFTTSRIGLPPTDVGALEGRTYQLDFASARVHEPSNLVALFDPSQTHWLWQVHSLAAGTPEAGSHYFGFGVATEEDGQVGQNLCASSDRFGSPEVDVVRTNSYFSTDPADMNVTVGTAGFAFEEAHLDGDFDPEGEQMTHVGFSGWLRADSLDPLAGGDGSVCSRLTEAGMSCVPCPSGSGECVLFDIDRVEADWVPELALTDVDAVDVAGNEDCEDAVPTFSCSQGAPLRPGAAWLLALTVLVVPRRRSA